LYKFNLKTTPTEPILVIGEYHFDFGLFGFDFGAFSAIISITAPCRMGEPVCVQDPQSVNLPYPSRPPASFTKVS